MRRRPVPAADESLEALREAGVADAPTEGPEEELRGLLDLALFVAEHRKRISFPAFSWDDPAFVAADARRTWRVAYARLPDAASIGATLDAALPRLGAGTLLALDAHAATDVREFDLSHDLYGRVTLFQWPTKPVESADPRIHDALDKGWAKTLKAHNLVPGRGIVVLDEHQGLLLREPRYAAVPGMLVLLADGHTNLWWNPVSPHAESEDQYWLTWGEGTGPASGWKEQLFVERDED